MTIDQAAVDAETAAVWRLVEELASTPEGIALMEQAAARFPQHEE